MPTTNYYNSFDISERDENGYLTPLTGETLEIRLVSDDSLIGSTTSDDYGYIQPGGFSLAAGTEIYFLYTKGEKFYQKLYPSVEVAELKNLNSHFIVDDLNANIVEADTLEIWVENLDEPDEPRRLAGTVDLHTSTALTIPSESFYSKNLKFTALSKTENGTYATTDFKTAQSANFAAESASANDTSLVLSLLPDATGHDGEFLRLSGGVLDWQAVSAGLALDGAVGGSNNQILYQNGSGNLAQSANLTFNGSVLGLTGDLKLQNSTKHAELSLDSSYVLNFGHDYSAGDNVTQYNFKYYGSGGYGARGLKIADVGNGFAVVLNAVSGNGLYLTDASGTAVPLTLGTWTNPADGSTFTASYQAWTISAGAFVLNTLRHLGFTSSAGLPTTTQLPNNKDLAIHKDTGTSKIYLAFNDSGTIKKVELV